MNKIILIIVILVIFNSCQSTSKLNETTNKTITVVDTVIDTNTDKPTDKPSTIEKVSENSIKPIVYVLTPKESSSQIIGKLYNKENGLQFIYTDKIDLENETNYLVIGIDNKDDEIFNKNISFILGPGPHNDNRQGTVNSKLRFHYFKISDVSNISAELLNQEISNSLNEYKNVKPLFPNTSINTTGIIYETSEIGFFKYDEELLKNRDEKPIYKSENCFITPSLDDIDPVQFSINPEGPTKLDLRQLPFFAGSKVFTPQIIHLKNKLHGSNTNNELSINETKTSFNEISLFFIENSILGEPLYLESNRLRDSVYEISTHSDNQKGKLALILDSFTGSYGGKKALLIPFEANKIGGSSVMLFPSYIEFDLSPAVEKNEDSYNINLKKINKLSAELIIDEIQRHERPDFDLRDITPSFNLVSAEGRNGSGDYQNSFRLQYPLNGGGGIHNYINSETSGSGYRHRVVPVVLFINKYNSKDTEKGVQLFFGMSQTELEDQLKVKPFFYSLKDFKDGYPKALIIAARDKKTFTDALENDEDFNKFVEKFYDQKYHKTTP